MVDIIAGITELIAMYLVGNKNKFGFILGLFCNFLWTYVAFTTSVFGLLFVVFPMMVINIRNFIKWSKSEIKNDNTTNKNN